MKSFKKWIKERDEVMKTYDVTAFKVFYRKWYEKGIYDTPILPPDNIIEISMRKCVYHMTSSTKQEKEEAAKWLSEHWSNTEL